jgi:hypothetical protein
LYPLSREPSAIIVRSLLALRCNAQTPGAGAYLCHANAISKILKLAKLSFDLPSYFLQMSRAAVNLITHWNAPENGN